MAVGGAQDAAGVIAASGELHYRFPSSSLAEAPPSSSSIARMSSTTAASSSARYSGESKGWKAAILSITLSFDTHVGAALDAFTVGFLDRDARGFGDLEAREPVGVGHQRRRVEVGKRPMGADLVLPDLGALGRIGRSMSIGAMGPRSGAKKPWGVRARRRQDGDLRVFHGGLNEGHRLAGAARQLGHHSFRHVVAHGGHFPQTMPEYEHPGSLEAVARHARGA